MFIYCICTQYLVGAPFALITASIRRGMEVISLWHCWGGLEAQVYLTVAFSSSAFFGLLFLIFLLTKHHRFSMFRSGEFSGQSSTPTPWSFNQLLVLLAVWAVAKSWWKMKSASLKSWSAEGSMKCSKMYCKTGAMKLDLKKHNGQMPADDIAPQIITDCGNLTLDFKELGLWPSPPSSRTLVSKWNAKLALIWKKDFGPLGNSPVLLLLSPGKTPLTITVAKFLDKSGCGGSWCLYPGLSPFLVKFTQILESILLTILIRLRFSRLAVYLFLSHFFLPLNFLLTCLDTELCEQPASLVIRVCGLPSLWRVSMIVFWTTVRSAVFPMIV